MLSDLQRYILTRRDIRDVLRGRLYYGRVPASVSTLPVMVMQRISTPRWYTLSNEVAVATTSVQVDLYDHDPVRLEDVAENFRLFISGSNRFSHGDTYFQAIHIERESVLEEKPQNSSDKWTFRYSWDLRVAHDQTVPTHTA